MERTKKEIREIRRNNAKLYPIYRMFSWDLLLFYSIEFLFCTITKGVSAADVLILNGFYLFFTLILQIPAVTVTDFLGRRKSIIFGNMLLILQMLILIYMPGLFSIMLANFVCAFGFDIKTIAESNLLYDSVSTKGGEGLYSKLASRGGSYFYILDGVASLVAGYLFVINNYIPIYICLGFIIISTLLSFKFKDVYVTEKKEKVSFVKDLKEYGSDLKTASKFILKSKRMKAIILFKIVLYSTIEIVNTYNSSLLINIGIPEAQFSMIFAVLTLIGGISLVFRNPIEKRFRNRTLSFISLMYIGTCIIIGITSNIWKGSTIIPLVLIMLAIQKINVSIWYILESKYIRNFTKESMRNKISFTYEFIGGLAASIAAVLGGFLLDAISVEIAFLVIGTISLICMLFTLKYMKTRIGLKPEEYSKEDIMFEEMMK